jgi:hypothetical protein
LIINTKPIAAIPDCTRLLFIVAFAVQKYLSTPSQKTGKTLFFIPLKNRIAWNIGVRLSTTAG